MKYQIDIETMSTAVNCVILSVGICNENGVGEQLYLPIMEQMQRGRIEDEATIAWWNEEERVELFSAIIEKCLQAATENVHIADLHDFLQTFFMKHDDEDTREVWMNSPAFDGVRIEALLATVAMEVPWHYRDPRDFRTLKNLALQKNPDIRMPAEPEGLHDALVDCKWQMVQTQIYLTELGL